MVRSPWDETGAVFNFTTAGVKIISAGDEKKKILPGSTVNNITTNAQTMTFFLTTSGGPKDATTNICEDGIPLASKELVEIPEWFIPPGHELWGVASNNSAINGAICWKVESTR